LTMRRVDFKIPKTILKQTWVQKWVVSIINLRNDYFIVYFSNEDDYTKVLEDEPWLIPNCSPKSATVDKAIVRVKIPNLPINTFLFLFSPPV
jgi:hypothetical protein